MIGIQPASVRRSSIRFGPAEITLDAAFAEKDGAGPVARLTADRNGVLYGTAQFGGLLVREPCSKYNVAAGIGCVVFFDGLSVPGTATRLSRVSAPRSRSKAKTKISLLAAFDT
jgi:hypothetical protein